MPQRSDHTRRQPTRTGSSCSEWRIWGTVYGRAPDPNVQHLGKSGLCLATLLRGSTTFRRFWLEIHDNKKDVIPSLSMDHDAPDNTEALEGAALTMTH